MPPIRGSNGPLPSLPGPPPSPLRFRSFAGWGHGGEPAGTGRLVVDAGGDDVWEAPAREPSRGGGRGSDAVQPRRGGGDTDAQARPLATQPGGYRAATQAS